MNKDGRDILKKLVSIDTSIERSTLEAVEYVESLFINHSIKPKIIKAKDDANRASIIATIGDKKQPGIILSGHLDTYGVSSQLKNWRTDPFDLQIIDNSFVGRGVVDMKGAIASVLSKISYFQQMKIPVHFVFTHDEEGRFTAINQLLENNFYNCFSNKQIGCIVMEPSSSKPIIGHKGYRRQEIAIEVNNNQLPNDKKDAIQYIIELYEKINKENKQINWVQTETFQNDLVNLNIGKIIGGTNSFNTPAKALLEYQIKYEPGDDNSELFLKRIAAILNKLTYKAQKEGVEILFNKKDKIHVLPFLLDTESNFCKILQENTSSNDIKTTSYGTEAGYFQKYGINNTVILGPGDYIYGAI